MLSILVALPGRYLLLPLGFMYIFCAGGWVASRAGGGTDVMLLQLLLMLESVSWGWGCNSGLQFLGWGLLLLALAELEAELNLK